jgi:hypothetical protein
MRTLLWLFLTIAASMIAAVAGLYVVRLVVPHDVLKANNDVAGNYLQTLGTIYAVLLAFVVFVVWTQQNEAAKFVEREANELRDLGRIACSFSDPPRSQLLDIVRAYAREVIDHEWAAMAHGAGTTRAAQLLESIWSSIRAFEARTPCEHALFAEAISRFNDLNDARTDLLQSSRTRMPPTLWLLLLAGGVATVASMYLFGLDSFCAQSIMTSSMAGAVSFVLFLIGDLDNPFSGDWQVTPEPMRLVLKQLDDIGQP